MKKAYLQVQNKQITLKVHTRFLSQKSQNQQIINIYYQSFYFQY